MSRLVVQDLGPQVPAQWRVRVPAPGPWVPVGPDPDLDRQVCHAWRVAARDAVEAAGVPRLRAGSVRLVTELRLPDGLEPGSLGRWLPTAMFCSAGVDDVCGVSAWPQLRMGPRAASPGGEIILHIDGEVR